MKLFDDVEVERPPPLTWLIEGLLTTRCFAVLYGAPGTGKSFVALDLAFAVATGSSWHGRDVERGQVLYVMAEGVSGLSIRVRAWKQKHDAEEKLAGVFFLVGAIQVLQSPNVAKLVEAGRGRPSKGSRPLRLVIIDTLARCMVGGNEDSAMDMGRFVEAMDRIRKELRVAVLVVHHTTKTKQIERGSGALRGAADTVIQQSKPGHTNTITLRCEKQKDSAPFSRLQLKLETITLSDGTTSCAVATADGDETTDSPPSKNEQRVLDALRRSKKDRVSSGELEHLSGLPRRTFHRVVKGLTDKRRILRSESGRNVQYRFPQGKSIGASARQLPQR